MSRSATLLRAGLTGLLTMGTVAMLATPSATAQEGPAGEGSGGHWLPFMGCWEPEVGGSDEAQEGMLCIRPASGEDGVEFLRVRDGSVATSEVRPSDGRRQAVQREGCAGWERASFSRDGRRVFLRSDVTCRGEVRRGTSGIMAMISPYEWIDVQSVRVDGRAQPWVQRYRLAPSGRAEAVGLDGIAADLRMAVESARFAAAESPGVDDVIEASETVEADAVEAWVAEMRDPFRLDADALVELADAGVDERVIDVMVAVSYPDRFELDGDEYEEEVEYGRRAARRRAPRAYGGTFYGHPHGFYDPFFGRYGVYGVGYRPYGLYGVGFGFHRGYRRSVVVVRPRADRPRGRVVNGRGYSRSGGSGDAGSRSIVPNRTPRGGGSVSPSGASRGGASSSTGRKAKKRGGKGGKGGDGGNEGGGRPL